MRGVGGSPPYPPTIKKPGCQGKSFDANFLEKNLASLESSAYAIRMKIEIEIDAPNCDDIASPNYDDPSDDKHMYPDDGDYDSSSDF